MTPPKPAFDIGNLHVIDYYLHRAIRETIAAVAPKPAKRFAPDDWSRYDGELL